VTAPPTLISAFAAQALRSGARPAVTDGVSALSYAELAARSDALAHTLRARAGVGRGSVVGISTGRSDALVVGMLAVLKSGAAYLPLDPTYPSERLRFMVEDSGAATVLVEPGLSRLLGRNVGVPLIATDEEVERLGAAQLPLPELHPKDAAYVIYTSGTTGSPKGTVVEHRNVLGLFEATSHYRFDVHDVWAQFHSPSFDFSVWEIWGALLHGGLLAIVPDDARTDPDQLATFIAKQGVTILNQTPSAFRGLVETNGGFPSLRLVFFGGEPVDLRAVERWLGRRGEVPQLVNMYGITETTVHVTELELTQQICSTWDRPGTPIGRPLPGASIRLVDPVTGDAVPPGEIGEIWVGGFGVARGYLDRPDLTAERFVVDDTGNRMYRSGDLARGDAEGLLTHLGRIDDQVKLRGFRVELPEVEYTLNRLRGVAKSAVSVQGSGADATLVAFVVPDPAEAPAVAQLVGRAGDDSGSRRLKFTELPNGVEIAYANPGETQFVYDEVYERRVYGLNGIAVPDRGCVVDVGANIGMFSLWASEQATEVAVFSFEPLPPIFALLETNLALHVRRGRAMPFGLGARAEEAVFYYFPHDTIFSGRSPGADERLIVGELLRREAPELSSEAIDELLDDRLRTVAYRSRIEPLSAVIDELGIDRIDLLKVDVEKSELEVFAGIEERHWPLIDQIAIEVHGPRLTEIVVPMLERRGFSVAGADTSVEGVGLTNVYARRHRPARLSRLPQLPSFRGRGAFVEAVRDGMSAVLPSFAVPSRIELVNALPMTANGKLDRAALALPEELLAPSLAAAEFNPTQRVVASVFENVLGRSVASPDDHFFRLGGQSLTGIEAVRQLRVALGLEIPIALLFRHPRVAQLAAAIESHGQVPAAEPADWSRLAAVDDARPSDAELPLWMFQDLFPASSALNVAREIVVRLPYRDDMCAALGRTLGRHPSLRTRFVAEGAGVRKCVGDGLIVPSEVPDLSDEPFGALVRREVNRPFDLGCEPPIRVFVGHGAQETTRILLVMHHIAIDGASMRALVRECAASVVGAPAHSESLADAARPDDAPSPSAETADAYWLQRLTGLAPLPLPPGQARSAWPALACGSTERVIPAAGLAPAGDPTFTPHAYLLASFASSLRTVLGAVDAAIGVPFALRPAQPRPGELGCFVTMAPIRLPSSSVDHLLDIHEQLIDLMEYGPPSATIVRLARVRSLPPGHHPLFQAAFLYYEESTDESFGVGGVEAAVSELRPDDLQFDLALAVAPAGPSLLKLRLEFRKSSFSPEIAEKLVDAFVRAAETQTVAA
jgi:amino acid adenylation domain-containing protein/FkbM family methyltransferase